MTYQNVLSTLAAAHEDLAADYPHIFAAGCDGLSGLPEHLEREAGKAGLAADDFAGRIALIADLVDAIYDDLERKAEDDYLNAHFVRGR